MRVLLAPDKFKGCLTAAEVAAAVAAGLTDARPELETILVPVADGGDGTVAAAVSAGSELITVPATGPTGEPIMAGYAFDGHRAVVELAAVVGLDRLPGGQLDPLGASTYGLGVVIKDALDRGAHEIVLGTGRQRLDRRRRRDGAGTRRPALRRRRTGPSAGRGRIGRSGPGGSRSAAGHPGSGPDHGGDRRRQPAPRTERSRGGLRSAEGCGSRRARSTGTRTGHFGPGGGARRSGATTRSGRAPGPPGAPDLPRSPS